MAREKPEIVELVNARDPKLLRSIVRQFLPQLIRTARGAGLGPERAEDVAQDTLVTFVEKADTFDGRAQVRTWLFGILYRKLHEAYRARKRDQRMESIDGVMEQRFAPNGTWGKPPAALDSQLHSMELQAYIRECLEQLKERYRAAFVLKEVEQFSTEEICKIMEINANNLGVVLYRARNGMRECLEGRGLKGSQDAVL